MKKIRMRLFSFVTTLTLFLCFTVVPTSAASLPFTDVKTSDWFYDHVEWVVDGNYFSGTSSTTFSPAASMNRAMFVTVLANREQVNRALYRNTRFIDVPINSWYAGPVEWAATWGIASGTGNFSFSPETAITRQDAAVLLRNYVSKTGFIAFTVEGASDNFSDSNQIASYAKDALDWAVTAGIFSGSDGLLRPRDVLTRAEAASVFRSFFELLGEGDRLPESPIVPDIDETLVLEDSWNGTSSFSYRFPYVTMDSPDADSLNMSLHMNVPSVGILEDARTEIEQGREPTYVNVNYQFSMYELENGNYLVSVLRDAGGAGTFSMVYDTTNFFMEPTTEYGEDRLRASSNDVLNVLGITPEEFFRLRDEAISQETGSLFNQFKGMFHWDLPPEGEAAMLEELITRSLDTHISGSLEEQMAGQQIYVDAGGNAAFLATIYITAAPNYITTEVLLPLDYK